MARPVGIEKLADDLAARKADEVRLAYETWVPGDTPIEKLFATALLYMLDELYMEWWLDADDLESKPPKSVLIETQKILIRRWPVDFYITTYNANGGTSGIVVECDGHDFHERTKEQAARDRSRDRELQALGHMVFRFTGSEIYRVPLRCAHEVCDQLCLFRLGEETMEEIRQTWGRKETNQ